MDKIKDQIKGMCGSLSTDNSGLGESEKPTSGELRCLPGSTCLRYAPSLDVSSAMISRIWIAYPLVCLALLVEKPCLGHIVGLGSRGKFAVH